MERILISQSEKNDGTDYTVVNGKLISDENLKFNYFKLLDNLEKKLIYNDDYLRIEKVKKAILLTSVFTGEDNVGRKISYMYLIDKSNQVFEILKYLEEDAKVLNRKLDSEQTKKIVHFLNNNIPVKIEMNKILLLSLIGISVIASILYFTKKENKQNKNESKSTRSSIISK